MVRRLMVLLILVHWNEGINDFDEGEERKEEPVKICKR